MKKILSILLVLSVALATVFAAPAFNGYFGYGYKVSFDGTIEAANYLNSADTSGNDEHAAFLYLKTSTDYFSLDFRANDSANTLDSTKNYVTSTNALVRTYINATATMKLDKFIADAAEIDELPVSLSLMVGNQSPSAKDTWAYADPYFEDDEIGLNCNRSAFPMGLSVGYKLSNGGSITGNIYASFADSDESLLVEALVEPVAGVRVQGAYVYNPKAEGDVQVAALVDVGKLVDADFDLDVSGLFIMNTQVTDTPMMIRAAVTGGYAGFGAFAEYMYATATTINEDKTEGSSLGVGVSYKIDTKYPITLSADYGINEIGNTNAMSAKISAKTVINGVTLQLRLGCSDLTSGDAGDWYARFATEIAF